MTEPLYSSSKTHDKILEKKVRRIIKRALDKRVSANKSRAEIAAAKRDITVKNRRLEQGKSLRYRDKRRIINLFKSVSCTDCGLSYPPCVMDFDHLDGTNKLFSVGRVQF